MNKEFYKMQKLAGLIKENFEGKPEESYDEDLVFKIADIIHSEVFLRDVPYSMQDGAQEVDPGSVEEAAKKIVQMLNK
jgi:hypothetical protein